MSVGYPARSPLSYNPSSSGLNPDASLLGLSAPHGPTTSTLADGGEYLREWATYFGSPNKDMKMDPGWAYGRENHQLPEAFKGSSVYLDLIVIYIIKLSQMYAITRLLPLRQWDNSTVITWSMWKFDDALMDRTPEESMSRLTTNKVSQGRETFFRWGKAALMEHGFAKTPRGITNWRMNMLQIANATVTTLCLGVIVALLSCHPMTFIPSQGPVVIEDEAQRRLLFQREIDEWGCFHKQESPVIWLWNRLKTIIQERTGETPNCMVVPEGSLQNNGHPVNNYFFASGKPADSQRPQQTPPGVSIFESFGYRTGERSVEDPMKQQRKIGQFGYALIHHLAHIRDCEYQTAMMDIGMFGETANMFTRIKYREGVSCSGLFREDPVTGMWSFTQYGKTYFAEYHTWGQFMKEAGVLDKWTSQLVDGDKNRLLDFINRVGTSKPQKPTSKAGKVAPVVFQKPGDPFISKDALDLLNGIYTNFNKVPDALKDIPKTPAKDAKGSGDGKDSKHNQEDKKTDREIFEQVVNKNISSNEDKWIFRYAAMVLLKTHNANLRNLLSTYLDNKPVAANIIGTLAAQSYSTTDAKDVDVFIQPFGKTTVRSVGRTADGWLSVAPLTQSSRAKGPGDLYAFFSTWATDRAGFDKTMTAVVNKFFADELKAGDNQQFDGQPGYDELCAAIEKINNDDSTSVDDKTKALMKQAKDGMYAYINTATSADLLRYTLGIEALIGLGGHFAAKSKKQAEQLGLEMPDDDLDGPESKGYIYDQIPILSKLLHEDNIFSMYKQLCRLPESKEHTKISEIAFTRLLILVEDCYTEALNEVKQRGGSEDEIDSLTDCVTYFLQECSWQRVVDVKAIIETPAWRDIFTRTVGINQLKEKAKSTYFTESLKQTMDQFASVMDALDTTFLSNWHEKLPKDVKDALKDQKSLFKILQHKVSDIEMINQIIEKLDEQPSVKDANASDQKLSVSRDYIRTLLLGLKIADGELVRFGLDNDMWPLIGLLYVKKDGTWLMGQAFAMMGDGRCGWTFEGHHDMQLQDDATHKMHVAHWTLYAKPVVTRKDGVAHACNVKSFEYIGGNENTLWDLNNEDHVKQYADNNMHYKSIFVIPVMVNKDITQMTTFDVTGTFNKYLGTTPEYCQDRMFPVMAYAWGWKKDPSNPLTRPIIPLENDQRNALHTIVHQTNQLNYCHQKRNISERVRGCGPWGDREYDGCGDNRRQAASYLYPIGPNGASITAIVF